MVFSELFVRMGSKLLLGVKAGIGAGAITLLAMADSSAVACEFFSVPQQYNTDASGEVVVIGHQSVRPYQVIVTSHNEQTLSEIRACVQDAFATRSRMGDYIQVASFEGRGDAETIGRVLRGHGYRSRVLYDR
ncbi:MAG: hypothetical protein AAFO84_11865 [Cyanobacteria bacterium J06598_1]